MGNRYAECWFTLPEGAGLGSDLYLDEDGAATLEPSGYHLGFVRGLRNDGTEGMVLVEAGPPSEWDGSKLPAMKKWRACPRCEGSGRDPVFCTAIFKDDVCSYRGPETACSKRLARCRELGNGARFAGLPSLRSCPACLGTGKVSSPDS